ncbi:peroxiredoxin-like family protein [Lacibacterium aquatile]|uniref:thioredoxin-dependent peroxiredoxin n=1 Tax=Lacibacterium aquatile TaxID=1168082 RepID=A0ABW5DLY6_9PROT
MAATLPPEQLQTLQRMIADLKERGVEHSALRPGMPVPRFALPNALGKMIDISEALAQGPLVLSFYRGGWCPYCSAELRALQLALPDLKALGASLIAISPDLPDHSLSTAEKHALDFDILSDAGNMVARRFGLVSGVPDEVRLMYLGKGLDLGARAGTTAWELPIPATYLVGRNGIVRLAFVDADYTQRLDPLVIIEALRQDAAA